jgi:hypothetical protein
LRDAHLRTKALGGRTRVRGIGIARVVGTRGAPSKANGHVQLAVRRVVVAAVNATDRQAPSNVGLIQKATSAAIHKDISTRIVRFLGVVVELNGAHRLATGIRNVGTRLVLQQDLGETLANQGVSTIRGNVPTRIVTSRVEIDGTIQTERNVGALNARGTGQGLEFDQKDFLGGALKILIVLGVPEVVVLHAVAWLLLRHGGCSKCQGDRRPLYPINLHVHCTTVYKGARYNTCKQQQNDAMSHPIAPENEREKPTTRAPPPVRRKRKCTRLGVDARTELYVYLCARAHTHEV